MEGWLWDHPWALLVTSPLQFQGKWYTIAMADSRIRNGKQKGLNMQSVTYMLIQNYNYVVITTMLR